MKTCLLTISCFIKVSHPITILHFTEMLHLTTNFHLQGHAEKKNTYGFVQLMSVRVFLDHAL